MASPAEALAALGPVADAKGSGRVTSLIWEHVINPFGRFGLDMGGKPGSISVQMAPGDTTFGRTPATNGHHLSATKDKSKRIISSEDPSVRASSCMIGSQSLRVALCARRNAIAPV